MRYFTYSEYNNDDGQEVTVSEEDIRREFYPWWYEKMVYKFGKEVVDTKYNFEHCLEDWKVVHWAWES